MPRYELGKTSLKRLDTCHDDIKIFVKTAIKDSPVDFSVVCGEREKAEQEKAFELGNSKARFGQSPHNFSPSFAVDLVPYVKGKLDWNAKSENYILLSKHLKSVAEKLYNDAATQNRIEWGGDWKTFIDKPHWQLRGWKSLKNEIN